MPKIRTWSQIRLVCPCHPDDDVCFNLKAGKGGGAVIYVCSNKGCPNKFSSDVFLKVIDKMNKYWDENKTFEDFKLYFRIKEDSMRMRYLKTIEVAPGFKTYVVEIANLTKQPQYKFNQ